jgi:hypothetical protein
METKKGEEVCLGLVKHGVEVQVTLHGRPAVLEQAELGGIAVLPFGDEGDAVVRKCIGELGSGQ